MQAVFLLKTNYFLGHYLELYFVSNSTLDNFIL